MADISTLQIRLGEAETALHRLLTGSMRERISRNGTEITYTRAETDKLRSYINDLKMQIEQAAGGRRRGIVNISF